MMIRSLAGFVGLLICLGSAPAETVRVATWNLQEARLRQDTGAPGSLSEILQNGAAALKRLGPDVICLQGISDWESCETLCSLIGAKNYRVVTCSAFTPDGPRTGTGRQVAIIARQRAILAWSEQVTPASGFALAVTPRGGQRMAIFSVQPAVDGKASLADDLSDRLLAEVKNLGQFRTNRPDAVLMLGNRPENLEAPGNPGGVGRAGFESVHVGARTLSDNVPDILVRNGVFVTFPRIFEANLSRHAIVACDIELGAASSAATLAARKPLVLPGDPPIPVPAAAITLAPLRIPVVQPPEPFVKIWMLWSAVGALVLFWIVGRIPLRRRSTSMALQVLPSGDLTPSGRNLLPEELVVITIAGWLKTRFLQRLLSQRQELIDNQALTTQRTLVIEEKLARVQSDLHDRISGYESRIQRLENELSAATAENRDLIRDQIHLLKKQLATAREEEPFLRN